MKTSMHRLWRTFLTSLAISVIVYTQRSSCSRQLCKTCKDFVSSFEKGLRNTENSNYAGGDTSWEEEKLGLYANSEVRLVEVLDTVCEKSSHKCHQLVENHEEHLERWWFKLRHKGKDDLKAWLCFEHMDVCCPENKFGPTCEACPGDTDSPCEGHGKCQGAEEKDGTGTCSCDKGYEGTSCESCANNFYSDSDDCLACDKACKDMCTGAGPGSCEECASGYVEGEEGVCEDEDECKEDDSLCEEGTYCFNMPGTYKCNACDKSCQKGCSGPGSYKCEECKDGYERTERGQCKDKDECQEDESLCGEGTHCENTPGGYSCKACHLSCKLSCSGPGAHSCEECKEGYSRENESCVDINECEQATPPCDAERELCQNLVGTHVCRCKRGLVKREGVCEEQQEEEEETQPEPTKKRAKKTKKKPKSKSKTKGNDPEDDMERREYPWYFIMGPLALLFVTQKYVKPNLVTSAGLVLVLTLVVVIHPE